jgi:hypothetical protein
VLTLGYQLPVGEDRELSAIADLDLRLNSERLLDLRSETRRALIVPSGLAVPDLDVHLDIIALRTLRGR